MRKLLLLCIVILLLFSGLILLFYPAPAISEIKEKQTVLEDEEQEKERVKANLATQEPMPSGVYAQWLSAREAKVFIDASDVLILDVRTQKEYEQGHIKGAKSIPVRELEKRALEELTDKWKMILIYDNGSGSCVKAANILTDELYMNVFVLGGIKDWPYELVK